MVIKHLLQNDNKSEEISTFAMHCVPELQTLHLLTTFGKQRKINISKIIIT